MSKKDPASRSGPPPAGTAASRGRRLPKAGAANERPVADRPPRKRREQQRAIDTKEIILCAALSEFAQVGYDAASIRNIAAITGLQHPLITYHFRTKEVLWKAVAENAFAEMRRLWDEATEGQADMAPIERLRANYAAFLRFTIAHPDFHHFMLRESRPGNPRMPWLTEQVVRPALRRFLPDIEAAQKEGQLPGGPPVLVHYMLIGMTSVLSSLKDEIWESAEIRTDAPATVDSYLGLLDAVMFGPAPPRAGTRRRQARHNVAKDKN